MKTDWPHLASLLAARIPRERLHPEARAWAGAPQAGEPWAVAFSGGADSLSLLLLLWAHWPGRRGSLAALHFNHRLRGAESDADESFCREVCAALEVKWVAEAWRERPQKVSEEAARTARFAFFERELAALGASALWLGQQKDDIAETMLMRLSRGSGSGGLAAPRPVQPFAGGPVRVRPLLTLTREELKAGLRAAGAPWREDASNAADDFFRNRIRQNTLPAWRAAAPGDALDGAAHTRALLQEDDAALEAWLGMIKPLHGRDLALPRLAGKPRALWRRALHRWLGAVGAGLTREGFEKLLAACESGREGRHSVGHGFAIITKLGLR